MSSMIPLAFTASSPWMFSDRNQIEIASSERGRTKLRHSFCNFSLFTGNSWSGNQVGKGLSVECEIKYLCQRSSSFQAHFFHQISNL